MKKNESSKASKVAKQLTALPLALTLALSAVAPSLSYANVLREPAAKQSEGIYDRLASWQLHADLKLFSTELFNGFGVKSGYFYKVEPSYNDGLFTRYDKYYFDTTIGKSDKIDLLKAVESDFKMGLSLQNRLELMYARQFDTSESAIKAIPYFYKQLPTSADRVINNLNVGDYVGLKGNLSVITSGSLLQSLPFLNKAGISIEGRYVVSGEFQISVLKLPDNKVRMKLVGLRTEKEKGIDVSLGLMNTLNVFGVDYIGKKLTRVLDLNPIKLSFVDGLKNIFMVDYVLDLNDQSVREAYEKVIRQATDLETLKVLNPIGNDGKVKNQLLMDISAIEELVQADLNKDQQRATRSFKGSMENDFDLNMQRYGIKLFRISRGSSYSENKLVSVGLDESKNYYRINSYLDRTEANVLFSFSKMSKDVRYNAIYSTNENFEGSRPEDLVISVEIKDRKFTQPELNKLKVQIAQTVTPEVYGTIDWTKWGQVADKDLNVAIRYNVVLHPEAMLTAESQTEAELVQMYEAYLKQIKRGGRDGQVKDIAKSLAGALNKKMRAESRIESFMQLRKNKLFKATGVRFMLSLLDQSKLQDLIYFSLEMESTNGKRLSVAYGNESESSIYTRLLYIQSILNNEGLDLRLESETIAKDLLLIDSKK